MQRAILAGHYWTVSHYLRNALESLRSATTRVRPAATPWKTTLVDPQAGRVELTGMISSPPGATELVILVHGLGGSADSPYCGIMAEHLYAKGLASLIINLRGADRSGCDIHHAGLTEDLIATFASTEVQSYPTVHLVGFSMGGHVALKFAIEHPGVMASVVAICSPLDLEASVTFIDKGWQRAIYRRHVLSGLREVYARAAKRLDLDACALDGVRTIREFDQRAIVPRFGFHDATDYYRHASVGPRLSKLTTKALYVAATHDPMVALNTVRPTLAHAPPCLDIRITDRGGHVYFPPELGVFEQVVDWLGG